MKRLLSISLAIFLWAGLAHAYDGIAYYGTNLNNQDHYNSSGKRLTKISDILQQDRANYYKFKRRDSQDQGDGYFTTYQRRLLFQKAHIKISPQLKRIIQSGRPVLVTVFVYTPSSIEVVSGLPPAGVD